MNYKSNYPVTIVESEESVYFVNPGGVIVEKEYDDSFAPFEFVTSPKGEKFTELNTLRKVNILKKYYSTLNHYYDVTRAKTDSFYKNIVLFEKEILKQHSIPGELKICSFDLEMETKGSFPKAEINPIISFGLHMMGTEYLNPIENDIIVGYNFKKEKVLLEDLIDYFIKLDPDIICGYFLVGFDLPYLYQRCKIHKLPLNELNRIKLKDDKPDYGFYISKKGEFKFTKTGKTLGIGRVVDDIYINSVKKDTKLNNLKNKKLKTVAEYFGLKDIYNLSDDQKINMLDVPIEDFLRYQKSDLRCTPFVFEKYIQTSIQLSNLYQWTIDMAINRTTGMLANNVIKQKAYEQKYIAIRSNYDIHSEIFDLVDKRTKGKVRGKFEGAYNFAKSFSLSPETQKHDINSEYPNLARQFGLSPDTTVLQSLEELSYDKIPIKNPYKIDKNCCIGFLAGEEYNTYSVPDRNINKRLIVRVYHKPNNILFEMITNGLDSRDKINLSLKSMTDRYEILIQEGISNILKILNNSIYGMQGSKYFDTGSIVIGIFITAAGRELGMSLHNKYYDEVIAIDTDGLMFNRFDKDPNETNTAIKQFYKTKFNQDICYIKVKKEIDKPTLLLQALKKNYVTYCPSEPEGKQIKLTGVNFKSSAMPEFIDGIIKKDIMLNVFKLYEDKKLTKSKVKKIRDQCIEKLNEADIKNFAAALRVSKDINEYSGISTPSSRIRIILENKAIKEKEKRELIYEILEKEIKNSEDDDLKARFKRLIAKQKPIEFYYSFALYSIDDLEQRSYTMSVKILDSYYERYGQYPVTGNTIEYYYSRTSKGIDLFENLKNKSQINYSKYENLILRTIETVTKCIGEEDSF